jgi:hypothetical protein
METTNRRRSDHEILGDFVKALALRGLVDHEPSGWSSHEQTVDDMAAELLKQSVKDR